MGASRDHRSRTSHKFDSKTTIIQLARDTFYYSYSIADVKTSFRAATNRRGELH